MAVEVRQDPNGDYALGAELQGVFVPFTGLSAQRVATLVENANSYKEQVGGDKYVKPAADDKSESKSSSGKGA